MKPVSNIPQRKIREAVFQTLFSILSIEQQVVSFSEMLADTLSISHEDAEKIFEYSQKIHQHCSSLESLIQEKFENEWSSLTLVDKTIIYLISYELLYERKLEPSILIAEAIRLAKKFAHQHAYKLIHVVMNALLEKESVHP